jgi:hypothetical protein
MLLVADVLVFVEILDLGRNGQRRDSLSSGGALADIVGAGGWVQIDQSSERSSILDGVWVCVWRTIL